MASFFTKAQEPQKPLRKIVVADIETRVPVHNAIVATKDGYRDTTNYRGICYIPATFDTLTVRHVSYLTERLLLKEGKDSTFLIPNNKRIGEVTIWGKDRATQLQENVKNWIRRQPGMSEAGNTGGIAEVDFASMLDKRRRKDQKNLRKTRKIFREMDQLDDDPIINAYKKEFERRHIEAEQAKKKEETEARQKQKRQQTIEEKQRQTEHHNRQTE